MSQPTIDVIVPVYNGEKYIAEALGSITAQTCPPRTIIVVDDGSTDATVDIIMQARSGSGIEIKYLKTPNSGLSSARNHGLKASTAEYVAFLDADDVWLPDKLSEQIRIFKNSPFRQLGVVYCDYALIDENGNEAAGVPIHPDNEIRGEVFMKLLGGNFISGSCSAALVRRECFSEAGYFDEALSAVEDWDMWLRIAKMFQFDYADKALVKIRLHACSMQKNRLRMFSNEAVFFDKWAGYFDRPASARWAKSLMVRIVEDLPGLEYYRIAKSKLSPGSKKKLFLPCFGSMSLYLFVATGYIWTKRAFRRMFGGASL